MAQSDRTMRTDSSNDVPRAGERRDEAMGGGPDEASTMRVLLERTRGVWADRTEDGLECQERLREEWTRER